MRRSVEMWCSEHFGISLYENLYTTQCLYSWERFREFWWIHENRENLRKRVHDYRHRYIPADCWCHNQSREPIIRRQKQFTLEDFYLRYVHCCSINGSCSICQNYYSTCCLLISTNQLNVSSWFFSSRIEFNPTPWSNKDTQMNFCGTYGILVYQWYCKRNGATQSHRRDRMCAGFSLISNPSIVKNPLCYVGP